PRARRGPRHGGDVQKPPEAADHRALPDGEARLPRPVPWHPRAHLRSPDGRGELHRLPALRIHLPAAGHQSRDAQGGEAELRQDLHARALRVRVLRALRAGVSHRRHHHDEVVRPRDGRSSRAAARQGPAPGARPAVRSVLGHRQPPSRHAGPTQAGEGRRPAGGRGHGPSAEFARPSSAGGRGRGPGAQFARPSSAGGRGRGPGAEFARPSSGGARRSRSDGKYRMTEIVGFWVAAVVLVAASLAVVLTPNLFHAVLWLAVVLVATGGVFLLLDSPFLFAVQLLLYAGGVV